MEELARPDAEIHANSQRMQAKSNVIWNSEQRAHVSANFRPPAGKSFSRNANIGLSMRLAIT